jgi:hypothetical protein
MIREKSQKTEKLCAKAKILIPNFLLETQANIQALLLLRRISRCGVTARSWVLSGTWALVTGSRGVGY